MANNTRRSSCPAGAEERPDERILRFIGRHRVMTLATADEVGELWCCNLFYATLAPSDEFPGGALVFTSPVATRHAAMFATQPRVAGSVVLESKVVGRLQGLQLQGTVLAAASSAELTEKARNAYLKRFPFAAIMLSDLWVLRLSRLKYTDNTLGFGTKLHWPPLENMKK